jgi:thiamine-monophosphate kinase
MDEFQLIDRYFRELANDETSIILGIGDDAAILAVLPDEQLLVSTDTHVENVHFRAGADADKISYRAFASSASDIVAMGGRARWASLALTMPSADHRWLKKFTSGAAQALGGAGATLIGGDTTSGPLTITWNIIGTIAPGDALRRDGARVGDSIFVTGSIGGAAGALAHGLIDNEPQDDVHKRLADRYWYPQPQYDFAPEIVGIASSCIDISDGLIADLAHIVHASGCGAEINMDNLPFSPGLIQLVGATVANRLAACGGDDYELCFTVPEQRKSLIVELASRKEVAVTEIGRITRGSEVKVLDRNGAVVAIDKQGYKHFE